MAEGRMAVLDMLRKATVDGNVDVLRKGVRVLAEAIMEAELTGAAKAERAPDRRLTNRNGYRERGWDTRVGTIGLSIPKVCDGSYFPSLLEPRRRAERALLSVVQEAYVAGVAAFRSRSLAEERYPYLFCDATYVKVRDAGRVVSMAALVAVGVASTGGCRILGLELAAGNDEGSAWGPFLRGLVERGPAGVRLVISDAHRGLVASIRFLSIDLDADIYVICRSESCRARSTLLYLRWSDRVDVSAPGCERAWLGNPNRQGDPNEERDRGQGTCRHPET